MSNRVRHAALVSALLLLVLAGCGGDGDRSGVSVVATTTQVADLARAVAGDRARVDQILEPNTDPHDYEPRPSDAAALADASVVVRSGGEVDEWLGDLLSGAGSDAETVGLLDAARPLRDGGETDPHWWQDPRNAIRAVGAIRSVLAAADPGGKAVYARNARSVTRALRTLDARVEACIARIPPRARKLVTTHDALAYYARRYGLEVIGALIPSRSTQAQPSARDTDRLVAQIRSEGVAAIFPESSLNPKLERAVSRAAGARVGGALYADALGEPGSAGATYAGAIAANTRAITAGLTDGRVACPARG